MGAALVLHLLAALSLAESTDVSTMLDRLGDADLVLVNDPLGTRPVRVLLATRVAASPEKARQVLIDPASYRKAMPAFRRVEVLTEREREPGLTELDIAWELEVPLSNLKGRLWLTPQEHGVALDLDAGDFSPGRFHVTATREKSGKPNQSLLCVEGYANLRESNWALRQFLRHSVLAEPAITLAASYVLLKALAIFIERGRYERPSAPMKAPDMSILHAGRAWRAASLLPPGKAVLGGVRSLADGRLGNVEVVLDLGTSVERASGRRLRPEVYRALPGWKKVALESNKPDACKDVATLCWAVESSLPLFSLGGTWKIWPRLMRARMVAGETKDAVMAVDILPGRSVGSATLVLAQQPRIHRAGYVAGKLVAAEPLLEHGLSLALTLLSGVSLGPALEKK